MSEFIAFIEHDAINLVDGTSFFMSDRRGDADGRYTSGFFFRDMRHLSTFSLEINGTQPEVLTSQPIHYHAAGFYLHALDVLPHGKQALSLQRLRVIGNGVRERLTLINHALERRHIELCITFDCDFADIFQARSGERIKAGEIQQITRPGRGEIEFRYRRAYFQRSTTIIFHNTPKLGSHTAIYCIDLAPHARWQADIEVHCGIDGHTVPLTASFEDLQNPMLQVDCLLLDWLADLPRLRTDWDALYHSYMRSMQDLGGLSFKALPNQHWEVPAAGAPLFMALFGRDSIITAYQALPYRPELAYGTLHALAHYQGDRVDDFRDETPGKILHELRHGDEVVFHDMPHSPYYGTVDATPLYLILLHEYWRWTGDVHTIKALHTAAQRALNWIDTYGDLDHDGYVEYQTKSSKGLYNQGWKDSDDSVLFADGRQPEQPIALVEVQGYVYDARLRLAELAAAIWEDEGLARRLRAQAAALRERILRDFWIDDRGGYFAEALDRHHHCVDAMTSNMGHLLWSGVLDGEKARHIAHQLLSEPMYSGWGIRTMSTDDAGYNPISYHDGTVWPHDNGLIAYGLMRQRCYEEAQRIITDMITASASFDYRLPEVFAGYPRVHTLFPVRYPTASSPQAWSAGTPLLMIRTLLGLEPDGDRLTISPHLTPEMGTLVLEGLPFRGKRYCIEACGESGTVTELS
jgi:glycogen debranching enzyme